MERPRSSESTSLLQPSATDKTTANLLAVTRCCTNKFLLVSLLFFSLVAALGAPIFWARQYMLNTEKSTVTPLVFEA